MKKKRGISIGFTEEQWQVIIDGTEDTQTLIREGIAEPVSLRYKFLVKNIRSRIEQRLRDNQIKAKSAEDTKVKK